ncbi:xanthine dehydrogenase family protein subunit M [Alicyclobacillus sp. SO9]|uniref:FAD binding domain-containing protein n=1 Tax=Alicyclobacillus sp. SO9 TaxID=2665646 RepID=UPI0018E86508|nr:FAD binding domain-containing protein [Alicyclobacillus sp. SO9]QQE77744.1 FAD binding domain-containing protein [Alicyclobacillus sp. SO9]
MKPVAFDYYRPENLADAVQVLQSSPQAKILAGGQSLIPMMNFRLMRPETLLDITGLTELDYVERTDRGLRIGALTRHQNLHMSKLVHEHFPVLAEAAGEIGHWAIRNRGTLGGSLTHADPASELPAAMVALHADIEIASSDGTRTVPAEEFFLGFLTTDLGPNELVTGIEVPVSDTSQFGFSEFARRPGDFALAGAFVELHGTDRGAVTWFGVSGGPERRETRFPQNRQEREAVFIDLTQTFDPLDEPEYKRRLAVTVAEDAYQNAAGRLD